MLDSTREGRGQMTVEFLLASGSHWVALPRVLFGHWQSWGKPEPPQIHVTVMFLSTLGSSVLAEATVAGSHDHRNGVNW